MKKIDKIKALILKNRRIFVSTIVGTLIILILIVAYLLSQNNFGIGNKRQISASPSASPVPKATPFKQTVWTVMATTQIFVPKVQTVIKGGSVSFVNLSGNTIDIEPNDNQTSNPFILGEIQNGQSVMVKMLNTGTYKYFNKLYPKAIGTIVVVNPTTQK